MFEIYVTFLFCGEGYRGNPIENNLCIVTKIKMASCGLGERGEEKNTSFKGKNGFNLTAKIKYSLGLKKNDQRLVALIWYPNHNTKKEKKRKEKP